MFNFIAYGYYNSTARKPSVYQKSDCCSGDPKYQLEFCTTGNTPYIINNKEYIRQYGSVMFVKPYEPYSHFYKVAPYECYAIHFNCNDSVFEEKYLKKLPSQIFLKNTYDFEKNFRDIIFPNNFEQLTDFENLTEMKNELLCSELKSLIINLYFETLIDAPQTISMHKTAIENAKKYIAKNFKNDISIKDISQVVHLSIGHTNRLFKKITGQTPHEYLLYVRLDYACSQLVLTNDSISEISLRSGFKNPTYLSTIFKKVKGITPLQYRKDNYMNI